jgi:hypothetical protein
LQYVVYSVIITGVAPFKPRKKYRFLFEEEDAAFFLTREYPQ